VFHHSGQPFQDGHRALTGTGITFTGRNWEKWMSKRVIVLVPVVLFMLVLVVISSILSKTVNRSLLRTPFVPHLNRRNSALVVRKFNMSTTVTMPPFLYGTAWKKERTKDLVEMAVRVGFRGIDTACQPKHYHEPGVGEALQALYTGGMITRSEIFLQTKFTSFNGQDPHRIPYDPDSPLEEQVQQSFSVSLQNLKTEYVDSLVLHGPLARFPDTMAVWRAMENIHDRGGARQIGISNVYDLSTLRKLYDEARVKPTVLQNRFYKDSGYDVQIREFCALHGIVYQSFWTLTANPHILKS
jgi:diketogulonate reductase-like aldo/keto reductase